MPYRFYSLCLAASLLLSNSFADNASAAEHTKESLEEIKRQVDAGKGVLVDVREQAEWKEGHIEGAIFFPTSAVKDGLTKAELDKLPEDKLLYVHCVVGKRALTVGNVLEEKGYQVRVLKPGYKELLEAGFPKAD